MIYHFAKYLFTLVLHSYFKIIKITGYKNIPEKGATIFIANHPSALMDPLVVGALGSRELYFIAAAEFMGKGILMWILKNWFHMIPVYRHSTQPGNTDKNSQMFDQVYSHLEKGGAILIFPEGVSETSRRIAPLKTGTARMAIGSHMQTGVPVSIVPVGLNYSDPHSFQSNLFMRIGEPIKTDAPYLMAIADEFERAKALTEHMTKALQDNVIHVEDERLDEFYEKLTYLTNHLSSEEREGRMTQKEQFDIEKRVEKGMEYYSEHDPSVLVKLEQKIDDYIERAKFYRIKQASVSQFNNKIKWTDYLRILFGIPIFAVGYFANFLPYYASVWLFKKIKVGEAFQGSIGLSIGLVFYLIWYIGFGLIANQITGQWWAFSIVYVLFYLTGRFALHFIRIITSMRNQGHLHRLVKRKRDVVKSLLSDRMEILSEIAHYESLIPKEYFQK